MLFGLIFCSSQQLSQIVPTAENDSAAIPPPIFFMDYIPYLLIIEYEFKHVPKYNYILYTPQPMGPTKVTNCRGE